MNMQDDNDRVDSPDPISNIELPILATDQVNVDSIRVKHESLLNLLVWLYCFALIFLVGFVVFIELQFLVTIAVIIVVIALINWISWSWFKSYLKGHTLKVNEEHFPHVHQAIELASTAMNVESPEVFVMPGNGMFDVLVARRYTRRGLIIMTSNMMDDFSEAPTSREFMFFIGRQLGHIRAGHFKWWFIRDTFGFFSGPLYFAWRRKCHLTADRYGLMVSGDAQASFRALSRITIGKGLAPSTRINGIHKQIREEIRGFWCWIYNLFSSYPYMIVRMAKLIEYARSLADGASPGVFKIQYPSLKQKSILIIHGHDELALLQLREFFMENYPLLDVRVMQQRQNGAMSMAEKFEMTSEGVSVAIALMTPDDVAYAVKNPETVIDRARQNVVMEIGWAWARLGREQMLLFAKNGVEVPSDFSGIEVLEYSDSPRERLEDLRKFLKNPKL